MLEPTHILVIAEQDFAAIPFVVLGDDDARQLAGALLNERGAGCGALYRCDGPASNPLVFVGDVRPRC